MALICSPKHTFPLGATVIGHDVTERKRAEQAQIEATRKAEDNWLILDAVIQQMPAGVIITNADGSQARNNLEMDRIWRHWMPSEPLASTLPE
jgi:PAS domain-containing protein